MGSERCETCGCHVSPDGHPESYIIFCSPTCSTLWDATHPEEASKWIAVEDLTFAQRAELDAILGHHAGAA